MTRIAVLGLLVSIAGSFLPAESQAQYEYSESFQRTESPEWFAFELRVGGYQPDGTNGFDEAFAASFGGDIGPMVGLELDFYPVRIPYVGQLGLGFRFNWARYTGAAQAADGSTSTQEQKFRLFALPALAVLRVDVLARELDIPLVLVGKIGFDTVISTIENGSRTVHEGIEFGLHWGAQAALELDFINPRRAASLDSEWGINHTYLLFELFGNTVGFGGANLAWTLGLGMTF
jgi:hypothetical protein